MHSQLFLDRYLEVCVYVYSYIPDYSALDKYYQGLHLSLGVSTVATQCHSLQCTKLSECLRTCECLHVYIRVCHMTRFHQLASELVSQLF